MFRARSVGTALATSGGMGQPTSLRVAELSFFILVVGVAAGLGGCGSDAGSSSGSPSPAPSSAADSGAPSSGAAAGGQSGVTACGSFPDNQAKSCQAGQYCSDERISRCQDGCLSDNNCAGNQTCDKSGGSNTGTCLNVAPATTTSCADLCKKAKACNPQLDTAQCEGGCVGFTEECKACVIRQTCNAPRDACKAECK